MQSGIKPVCMDHVNSEAEFSYQCTCHSSTYTSSDRSLSEHPNFTHDSCARQCSGHSKSRVLYRCHVFAGSSQQGFSRWAFWTSVVGASLTCALLAAAFALWLDAHAAQIHRGMHSNIEQYQTLQSQDQVRLSLRCTNNSLLLLLSC